MAIVSATGVKRTPVALFSTFVMKRTNMHSTSVRVWDLPTRFFHWLLACCVVGLVVSAKINAFDWHFRLGYVMLALLVFRLIWGLIGGRWSRFTSFIYSPARLVRYLRGKDTEVMVGHSPLAALSVFALLGVLILQVASGLLSDDEISFSGPLTRFVSGEVVSQSTWYHAALGQYLIYGLVTLHVLAILVYVLRGKTLVRPMIHGDQQLPASVPASRDDAVSRILAIVTIAIVAGVSWWVSTLGTI